jgi:uncharacterized protein (TIGR03086 family)
MTSDAAPALLDHALGQAGDLLGRVRDDQLDSATPCAEWTVGDLVDHLVQAPASFTTMMQGEQPDWSVGPPHVGDEREARFREHADALAAAWSAADGPGEGEGSPLAWQLAELAVHTWDLATAIGESTEGLDPEVAEQGLAFMQGGLTDDNRAPAFGAEQPAPAQADAYTRLAAFAGRAV